MYNILNMLCIKVKGTDLERGSVYIGLRVVQNRQKIYSWLYVGYNINKSGNRHPALTLPVTAAWAVGLTMLDSGPWLLMKVPSLDGNLNVNSNLTY